MGKASPTKMQMKERSLFPVFFLLTAESIFFVCVPCACLVPIAKVAPYDAVLFSSGIDEG